MADCVFPALGRVNVKNEEIDEMLKEAPGPINFTVFLQMFGEKLKGKFMCRSIRVYLCMCVCICARVCVCVYLYMSSSLGMNESTGRADKGCWHWGKK